ncbi:MAG: hypothetical protein JO091_03130 [Acidobacteriaceae bacterium]|nr:hypothetical protein [Acidobacteriaceae bacterium]
MRRTRRTALFALAASAVLSAQDERTPGERRAPPLPPNSDEDVKLPNGKSQKNEIAKQEHEHALKDAEELVSVAQELREELKKSGNYVVSVSSVKKTEEIERLARKIRGRLKQ